MSQTISNTSEEVKESEEIKHDNLLDVQEEIDKVIEQDKKEEEEKFKKDIREAIEYNMNYYKEAMNNTLLEIMEGTENGE